MVFKKLFQSLRGSETDSAERKVAMQKVVTAEPVAYKDITIIPAPLAEGGQYKTAGSITQMIDGIEKKTEFIRADNHSTQEAAVEHSIKKAKQIIDERGASLFSSDRC